MAMAAVSLLDGCRGGPHAEPHNAASAAEKLSIPSGKTQLVTVVSEGWDEFRAELRRYERTPGEAWAPVDEPVAVVLGRNGYAWGRGLHGSGTPSGRAGPEKREGDGRSPAGIFELGTVYGYDTSREELSLPYIQATSALRCVDDPSSRHYNRIVSTEDTRVDWESAERMRRDDALYVLTIVVEHNTHATQPGSGSCIFLHLWKGPDEGMSGCTAMSMQELETLASWLKPGASVLVALPDHEYRALARAWELPPRSVTPD